MRMLMRSAFGYGLVACSLLLGMVSCNTDPEIKKITPAQSGITTAKGGRASSFDYNLALRWAPIHFQDTDVTGTYSLNGKSDYITSINFDNDWVATNNWNNAASAALNAHVYFSVTETSTHWYIIYAFFHPRDWTDIPFLYTLDQHENDLEGALAIVQKNGTTYGSFIGMITVSHSDFYSFTPAGSPLQSNAENIDGSVSFETTLDQPHPMTAQEAKGHGLKAYPYYNINGDGIKYYPSASYVAEAPANADDRYVPYKLVDIFEPGGLWEQRFNTNLFTNSDGGFKSSVGNGNANAPWAWDDGNDVPGRGELATDPAKVADSYFKNFGNFSTTYLKNPYQGI